MLYLDDGDWVESLAALVAHHDGRLEVVRGATVTRERGRVAAPPVPA